MGSHHSTFVYCRPRLFPGTSTKMLRKERRFTHMGTIHQMWQKTSCSLKYSDKRTPKKRACLLPMEDRRKKIARKSSTLQRRPQIYKSDQEKITTSFKQRLLPNYPPWH